MRIAALSTFSFIVVYLACCDGAAPQVLKSQSLIPFPRVGRSRPEFLQSLTAMAADENGNINVRPNAMANILASYRKQRDRTNDLREFKRHLIPFPRVGKRQSLIPFPRVGRGSHFLADDEDGLISIEDSGSPLFSNEEIFGGGNSGKGLFDSHLFTVPQMRWMMTTSQESDESN